MWKYIIFFLSWLYQKHEIPTGVIKENSANLVLLTGQVNITGHIKKYITVTIWDKNYDNTRTLGGILWALDFTCAAVTPTHFKQCKKKSIGQGQDLSQWVW